MATTKANQLHLINDLDVAALVFGAVEKVEAASISVVNTVSVWMARSADRRQLATMNDRMLQDVGLSRVEVEHELSKFFWQK